MDGDTLIALIVPTAAIMAGAWAAVRLLQPFANALAEWMRPKRVTALQDEVKRLQARIAELEREAPSRPAIGSGDT